MMEKSPTVSGEIAVGILIGIGIWWYITFVSNSCVSRGIVYFGPCCIAVIFVGDSGDDKEFDRDSSARRCCIILSNFSTYRSLRSLACKIWRSRVDSWGIKDKSMELTASYKAASVSGKGDLKYSSRASNRSGYRVINILKGDEKEMVTLYI